MHHHRLVLNGPPDDVGALARVLSAAGAEPCPGADPPRLTWSTPSPPPLPRLCSGHPRVVVGVERFALLGDTLERLVLRGASATVLERLPFAPVHDDAHPILPEETVAECARLPPALLHAAGTRVAEHPLQLGPGPTASALDDALLVGAAIGRVSATALATPFEDDDAGPPTTEPGVVAPPAVLDALAGLAAAAITAAANTTDPATAGELVHERAHQLTDAHAIARTERLWSRVGDADWPEWLMYVLLGATAVVEDCAVVLHQATPPLIPMHGEHGATREERLGHATSRLVATVLQALALFAPAPLAMPSNAGGCARN